MNKELKTCLIFRLLRVLLECFYSHNKKIFDNNKIKKENNENKNITNNR